MKILGAQPPTREQLQIISEQRLGVEIIRGAAGSGKTTTALLRLKNLSDMFRARHRRLNIARPVQVLVLTYNRTLSGYVEALASQQVSPYGDLEIEVDTFAGWALSKLGPCRIPEDRTAILHRMSEFSAVKLPTIAIDAEVEYILGRFPSDRLDRYLDAERTGRGLAPRVERSTRQALLRLIAAYKAELARLDMVDWEELPSLVMRLPSMGYDIVIIDEAQDFSANQIRTIPPHLGQDHAFTLIIDTAQRLYPRGYTWAEVGISVRPNRIHRLQENHRNTIEIARFAEGIVSGLTVDDDGTLPDFNRAVRHGDIPIVVNGLYSRQLDFAIKHIRSNVDLREDSVAFLKPRGGGWFSAVRTRLTQENLPHVSITRNREWPVGPANIALSTMHSAKGLEFDHVIILGLSAEVTPHGNEEGDDQLVTLRRLLAMAVARARKTVLVGFKPGEASDLVAYFENGTFNEVSL